MAETIEIGGLTIRFLRDRHETGGSLDLFEMIVPPEGRMPVAHFHLNWDETVYGLSGAVTFTVAGAIQTIGPGDTLFIPRGVVHGFDNRSGAVGTCLCTLTPGVLGPEYFRELAAVLRDGPPDRARMEAIMLRHGLIPAANVGGCPQHRQ